MHGTHNIKIHLHALQYHQGTTIHTHTTSSHYKCYNNQAVKLSLPCICKSKYCTYSCSSLVSPWNTLLSISL